MPSNLIDTVEVVRDLGYSRTKVFACSALIFLLDMVNNLDHGAIPASITVIQSDLGLSNTQMGSLGSAVFFGIMVGAVASSMVFKKFDYRTTIGVAMLINGIFLYTFSQFT